MDYLSMIKKAPQEKLALITDEVHYTYGELAQAAESVRGAADFAEPVLFIHEKRVAAQLVQFLAYSGTRTVPIIATAESAKQSYEIADIPQAACMGVLTSGSTGKSKLLWRNYASWADFFPEQNRIFGLDDKTVIFCQGSLAFTGNLNIYMGVLATGATIVATEKFRPKHWLELIQQHDVNAIYLIPSKLMLLPKFIQTANVHIRSIISGSQSMGCQERERLREVFPLAEVTLYYGASELNYITYIKGNAMTEDRTCIGKPFKGVQVSIREEEIFIDTPYHVENISLPFSLKDRGRLDEDGKLHFLGRTDDICSINGRKVSTAKVQDALLQLPGVEEVAVLPIHEGDADVLTAFIAAGNAKKFSKQELVQLLREKLEDYELPKRYRYFDELPHNESGKVDKKNLLHAYGEC